ncbi:methionyl-tRNA formyltransferase [Terriglobus tenax]|uniref:methionyl-tRNA formyltransferase n=1 Tax=Terriglobus tenax TaxID=1111115 RepID=UPI0021DF43D9|nr:methionyl-tRNA formyltransferase [Terriglobus tenax]
MRLVFCGTPQFAVPTLQALIDAGHEIPLVVTQPDRPVGRTQEIVAPPVKQLALAHGRRVLQPEKIKTNEEFRRELEAIAPEVIVVVAYGRIIPKWMLELPKYGNINGHASLLPKYRGAAPIQWAIANGETVTGVTTILLDEGLDTGAMLLKREVPVGPEQTSVDLFPILSEIGASLMVDTLRGLELNTIAPVPQNEAEATLAPILSREDGRIQYTQTAQWNVNRWRGFQPWPGCFTVFRGKKLTVHAMRVVTGVGEPGAVRVDGETLLVACANGSMLALGEVQVEGKKRMAAADFLNGYQVKSGEVLG